MIALNPMNPAMASITVFFIYELTILTNSARIMVENPKNPRIKAESGWLNSSGLIKAYFIMVKPSLAVGKQVKWSSSTVKNKAKLTSVSRVKLTLRPAYIKITMLNIIWMVNRKQDL